MRDEQQLLQLRPDLQLTPHPSLRPILKLQHPLLVKLFETEILRRKNVFFQLPQQARLDWITNAVRSDQRFRNLLMGAIIGHFTLEELKTYEAHEAECSRRLVSLIIQRLQSVDYEADLKVSGVQGIKLKAVKEVAV